MTRTLRFPAILLSAAFIAAACSGGGGGSSSAPAASEPGASASGGASGGPVTSGAAGEINVLSLWGGSEEEAFKKVLADFTAKTGWGVKYEADRQTYSTTLQSRITGGNPPDIAIIPGIGFLRRFAKDGSLKKISDLGVDASTLTQDYPEGFLAAGTVDGELYALPAKYNNKGTMWFRPDVYKAASVTAPKTWDEYKAMLETTKDKPGAMPVGAVPGRDAMAPPQLTGHVPIADIGKPVLPGLLEALGQDPGPAGARGIQRPLGEWLGADEPLGLESRLEDVVAALAAADDHLVRLLVGQVSVRRKLRHDHLASLVAVEAVESSPGVGDRRVVGQDRRHR